MMIGTLRPDNADRHELSHSVGEGSDRQGRLACVQRRHRYRFAPTDQTLKRPLGREGASLFAGKREGLTLAVLTEQEVILPIGVGPHTDQWPGRTDIIGSFRMLAVKSEPYLCAIQSAQEKLT